MSRVSRLCPIFRAQPGAYPPKAPKPDVAPPCGSVGGKCSYWQERQRGKPLATNVGTRRNGQNRGILDAAARKQDKRMASELTLFLFTTARSADCIKGLRRRCDWSLFGGNYARLASGIPQTQSRQGILACRAADWRIMSKEENRLNFPILLLWQRPSSWFAKSC